MGALKWSDEHKLHFFQNYQDLITVYGRGPPCFLVTLQWMTGNQPLTYCISPLTSNWSDSKPLKGESPLYFRTPLHPGCDHVSPSHQVAEAEPHQQYQLPDEGRD